jgi:hypothetical protein
MLGLATVAGFTWGHRGTLVRVGDLALDTPRLVHDGGARRVVQRGRLLFELDRALPTDMDVRISGVEDGSVTLAGDPGPTALSRATEALCRVRGVVDVRTDGTGHPVLGDAVTAHGWGRMSSDRPSTSDGSPVDQCRRLA